MQIMSQPLRRLAAAIFERAGCGAEEAGAIAEHLVEANLTGHDSHGVIRVASYIGWMREGKVLPNKQVSVVFENEAMALLDGNMGFGQVIAKQAMARGIEKAKAAGLAMIGVRNTAHLGRVGAWAEQCAAAGLGSVHFVNTTGLGMVGAPFGGVDRRLSTNPVAAGMPVKGGAPVILDMATTALAEGKVHVALNKGAHLPENTVVDGHGRPSREPAALYGPPPGALLPFGAHKGYGLCVFCELFAGIVTGGGVSQPKDFEAGKLVNNMVSFIFDPERFGPSEAMAEEVKAFAAWVKSSRPLEPGGEVLMTGEPELRSRALRSERGIPIDDTTWGQVVATAEGVGLTREAIERLVAA